MLSLEIKKKKVVEIMLHKVREVQLRQEILPKIAYLLPLFLFKLKTVLL